MKRSVAFFALLALIGAAAFAQTRESVRVYVQSTADDPAAAVFFRETFAEEIEAAGYGLAYRANAADYTLDLAVRPNMVTYDDGVTEPAPPGEKQFILQISLKRVQGNAEIVAFSFPFTYLSEMDAYRQYLFYQVMTNLPYSVPDSTQAEPRVEYRYMPREDETAIEALTREITQAREEARRQEETLMRELSQAREEIREESQAQAREEARKREEALEQELAREREEARRREEALEQELAREREELRRREEALALEVARGRVTEIPVPVEIEVVREVQVPVDVVREVPVRVEVEVIREREVFIEEPGTWQNKWLYFRASVDVPFSYFMPRQNQATSFGNTLVAIPPGATLGMEFQLSNPVSVELDFVARFADVWDISFNPGAALQVKFPLKPSRYLTVEPFLGAAFMLNNAPHSTTPFYLEAGGGLQFGVKSGQAGAIFLDVNFMHTFNNVLHGFFPAIAEIGTKDPDTRWNRFVVAVGIGYKVGFADRK